MESPHNFIIATEISSGPYALFSCRTLMISLTSSSDIKINSPTNACMPYSDATTVTRFFVYDEFIILFHLLSDISHFVIEVVI